MKALGKARYTWSLTPYPNILSPLCEVCDLVFKHSNILPYVMPDFKHPL